MRLHVGTRLTCLAAAVVLAVSHWTLDHFCDVYRLNSLGRIVRTEVPTPAEQICWQQSGGGLVAALYLGLLLLAMAGILGDGTSRPASVKIGLRACVFLGVLAAFGMLTLALVTLHFYNHLDPGFGGRRRLPTLLPPHANRPRSSEIRLDSAQPPVQPSGPRITTSFADDFSTAQVWRDVPVVGSGSFSIANPATDGPTGGPYRETTFSFTSPGLYRLAHVAYFSLYSPQRQGAIASLDFTFRGIVLNRERGDTAYSLLVLQDGTYYLGPVHIVTLRSWAQFSDSAITASSFTKVGGPGPDLPDFSDMGPGIRFGYMTSASSTADNGNTVTVTSGIADWSITIGSTSPP